MAAISSAGIGSGLDVKALLAKTSGALSSYTKDDRLVEIQQKVDFCGEEVLVTKRVKVGSKEEVAYRQGGAGSAASTRFPRAKPLAQAAGAARTLAPRSVTSKESPESRTSKLAL
jgi:hypothetical protein